MEKFSFELLLESW